MKNSKKGISLILLVITIIVIIILAAAVILTLNNNNPIANARVAVDKSDYLEAQDAFNLWIQKVMTEQLDSVTFYGEISSATPTAGKTEVVLGTTGDDISDKAEPSLQSVTINKLGLPSKISKIYVNANRVVGMVKDGVKTTYNYNDGVVTTTQTEDALKVDLSTVNGIDPMA